jgi:His/Glu/Gln/Arg/opine family amino acid ABC transporter permease subunit
MPQSKPRLACRVWSKRKARGPSVTYNFNWDVVWRNFDRLWNGLLLGFGMAAVALVLGCVLGFVLALALTSKRPIVAWPAKLYVELIRNAPLLLLVFFIYFGLPKVGISILDSIPSFILALTLYAAGYLAEVFRAGLTTIPSRYIEAGMAIGLTQTQINRYVTLPIMLRIVLPSLGTTLISLFKDTSLAAAIAVPELTFGARWINVRTFQVIEVWTVAAALYLSVSWLLAAGTRYFEQRLAMIR